MMKLAIRSMPTLLCILFVSNVFGSYNKLPNYYPSKFVERIEQNRLKDQALKSALREITASIHIKTNARDAVAEECPSEAECESHVTTYTYREAREILFGSIHLEKDNSGYFLNEVYCEQTIDQNDGVGPGKIPDHTLVNCEHTWPQSRFNPDENKNAQLTDLHHLYPANSRANSSRGNNIFAEVDGGVVNDECTSSYRGRAHGSSEIAFEPPNHHKGDVARALFYFSVRYNHPIGPLEEQFLKRWHKEDPVDHAERARHEKVYVAQKNRNPFIDAPELVDLVRDF